MPLWKLQVMSGIHEDFLYPKTQSTLEIRLNPGIPHCLRLFYPLVIQLLRSNWLEHIRSLPANSTILGQGADLEFFLFGEDRKSLSQATKILKDIQKGTCFYCGGKIHESAQVDHFIPWARYPRNLGFNFVLAHAKCNHDKRDTLAAQPHVEHWLERNEIHQREIIGSLENYFICDRHLTHRVANWAYRLDHESHARLWLGVSEYQPFEKRISEILETAVFREVMENPLLSHPFSA
jgi:hypothetical protein